MITVLALTLSLSLLLGLWRGGRLMRLADLRFDRVWILYAALVLGLAPLFLSISKTGSRALVLAGYAGVAVFLITNLVRQRGLIRVGIAAALIGWLLNAAAISANGGMPLSLWAYNRSGQTEKPSAGTGGFFKITIAKPSSPLRPLGDVIPIRPIHQVISVGDILLVVGIGLTIVGAMHDEHRDEVSRRVTQGRDV